MTKTCLKCDRTLPLDGFYHARGMTDGHLNKCKKCIISERMDRYYRTHPDRPYVNPDMVPFAPGRRVGYIVNNETGCWEWVGAYYVYGYGQAWINGRKRVAHRVYWERANGPVPDGLELDHLCRNPKCVNPKHLEAVDHATNVQRGRATKLTEIDVAEIRAAKETHAIIGRRYGIDPSHILRIRTGEKWKEAVF